MTLMFMGPPVASPPPPPAHTSRSVQPASLSVHHSITGHLKPRSGGYMTLNWEEVQAADGLFTHPSHTVNKVITRRIAASKGN